MFNNILGKEATMRSIHLHNALSGFSKLAGLLCYIVLSFNTHAFELELADNGEVLRWKDAVVPYRFDYGTPIRLKQAAVYAMCKISAVCPLKFHAAKPNDFSPMLTIHYRRTLWSYNVNWGAYTYYSIPSGPIDFIDIHVNGQYYHWRRLGPNIGFFLDGETTALFHKQIQNYDCMILHELCHAVGLAHANDNSSYVPVKINPPIMQVPVMTAHLGADDIEGLQALYGVK